MKTRITGRRTTWSCTRFRERISSGLNEEAYKLLTRNLRRTKPTYEALYLKAALEREMELLPTLDARCARWASSPSTTRKSSSSLRSYAVCKNRRIHEAALKGIFEKLRTGSSNGKRPLTNLAGKGFARKAKHSMTAKLSPLRKIASDARISSTQPRAGIRPTSGTFGKSPSCWKP